MGILADSFKATLDAMKEQDKISQQKTNELLADINALIKDLETIDFKG